MPMLAYDYEEQQWVTDPAAAAALRRRLYQAGLYRGRAAASGPAHDEPRWHPSDGLDSDPEAREHYSAGWRAGRAWRAESPVVQILETVETALYDWKD